MIGPPQSDLPAQRHLRNVIEVTPQGYFGEGLEILQRGARCGSASTFCNDDEMFQLCFPKGQIIELPYSFLKQVWSCKAETYTAEALRAYLFHKAFAHQGESITEDNYQTFEPTATAQSMKISQLEVRFAIRKDYTGGNSVGFVYTCLAGAGDVISVYEAIPFSWAFDYITPGMFTAPFDADFNPNGGTTNMWCERPVDGIDGVQIWESCYLKEMQLSAQKRVFMYPLDSKFHFKCRQNAARDPPRELKNRKAPLLLVLQAVQVAGQVIKREPNALRSKMVENEITFISPEETEILRPSSLLYFRVPSNR